MIENAPSYELITAVAAVIVAVCALATSIWQGWNSQKHSRLSVRPILRIDRHNIDGEPLAILVTNVGVGPAVVLSYRVYADEKEVNGSESHKAANAFRSICPGKEMRVRTPQSGDVLPVGESLVLISFPDFVESSEDRSAIARSLNRISVVIRYASVYDEAWVASDESQEFERT